MKQWTLMMRLEYSAVVTVEAETEKEATAAAKRADFVDDGMAGAELVNWEVRTLPHDEGEVD